MAKKNSIIAIEAAADAITFKVDGAGEFTLSLGSLSDDIRNRALIHGLVQKVSDAAAMPKADLPANPVEAAKAKFAAMEAVAQRLRDGDWTKRNGEGAGPVSGLIFRAFAEWAKGEAAKAKKPIPSDEQLRAVYDKRDRAGQLALRNVPEIAKIIERLKAERGAGAAAAVDVTALLAEIEF